MAHYLTGEGMNPLRDDLKPMRFHVVALPHTLTSKIYSPCAYSQKTYNFCKMMMSLGHEVYHYGGEGSEPPCTEHITTMTAADREKWWGKNDWKKDFFAIEWDPHIDYWQTANMAAMRQIQTRIQPTDFICLIGGNCQKQIADAFPKHMSVEYGIGYQGVFSKYKVFESYAWMHYVYGLMKQGDGANYDCVIPNYFDPADFPLTEQKHDYFLYIGRLISRKGVDLAVETTKRLGKTLILAGQGVISKEPGRIVAAELSILGSHVEHVGVVDIKQRGLLMGRAQAVFVPTTYIGPFEGVSVEALFCGTPVITSDWGCFAEQNIDGDTGFRVRSLGEAMWAATNLTRLWTPTQLRRYAESRFSIEQVRYRYEEYFRSLLTLWKDGWYTEAYDPIKRYAGGFR